VTATAQTAQATTRLVRVVDVDAHEGPVYLPGEDALYFTTLPRPGRISPLASVKRLALDGDRLPLEPDRITLVDADLAIPNGMAADRDGSLIVCEQGNPSVPAQLRRLDPRTGETSTIVDAWQGLRLNSPNDVAAKSDGTIWFTDPAYGYLQGFRPSPQVGDFVYRFDPVSGSLSVVADSFSKPNGIAFSPDESVLYVTDSGANQEPGTYYVNLPHHVIAYDVVGGRHLANQRLFAVTTPGFPDGLKVDESGRVYVSSTTGVQVFSPEGDLLGQIDVPGAVNFTFGGADRNILFITADTAIWAAALDTRGT
jgi:gluconolactonase